MHPERPRARRYPFVARIELTDIQSEARINALTCDLSLFGCQVVAQKTMPTGTKVRIRIAHAGAVFIALSRVSYDRYKMGMRIAFTEIESNQQLVLEKWIAQLRHTRPWNTPEL